MTKKGVRIAYGGEMVEKEVKMGRVELLQGVLYTQFFHIFKEASSKINPRHVLTPPKTLGFHLNPSYNKTQAFT